MTSPFSQRQSLQQLYRLVGWIMVVACSSPFAWGQDPSILGDWQGNLSTPIGELELKITLTKEDDGKLSGTLTSITQGNAEIPISTIDYDDGKLLLKMDRVGAQFEGVLAEDGKRIDGTFDQLNQPFKLVLYRPDVFPRPVHLETWRGELQAGGRQFDFQLRLLREPDADRLICRLDSLTEGLMNLTTDFSWDEQRFAFDLPATAASFEGEFNDARDQIVGKWQQAGNQYDLTFDKRELEETEVSPRLNRPQTPQPPFPYEVNEVNFRNPSADVTLAATLTIPASGNATDDDAGGKTPRRWPAVVLISGSGPQDRDETIMGHKPFAVIADHLTRQGIAVLRYDERGVGQSTGKFSGATTIDFAADALAAVEFLKSQSTIDPNHIGLIGHSEGGLIAPYLAAQHDQIDFIVMLAGPGVNGKQILIDQIPAGAQLAGASDSTVQALKVLVAKYVDLILAGQADDAEATQALFDQLTQVTEQGNQVDQLLGASIPATLNALDTPWSHYFLEHEPAKFLSQVRCPVLALNGSKDVQVSPQLNLPAIRKALEQANNPDVTIRELDNLNHLFQNADTGAGSEYLSIEETIAPAALQLIADWILERVQ